MRVAHVALFLILVVAAGCTSPASLGGAPSPSHAAPAPNSSASRSAPSPAPSTSEATGSRADAASPASTEPAPATSQAAAPTSSSSAPAPTIGNVSVSAITAAAADVSYDVASTASDSVSSWVEYGSSRALGLSTNKVSGQGSQTLALEGLSQGTWFFQVFASGSGGKSNSSMHAFSAENPPRSTESSTASGESGQATNTTSGGSTGTTSGNGTGTGSGNSTAGGSTSPCSSTGTDHNVTLVNHVFTNGNGTTYGTLNVGCGDLVHWWMNDPTFVCSLRSSPSPVSGTVGFGAELSSAKPNDLYRWTFTDKGMYNIVCKGTTIGMKVEVI